MSAVPVPISGRPRETVPSGFDYRGLPGSVEKAIREQAASIHGLLAKTSVNVVQIGLRLHFARDRLGRQSFRPWLEAEFEWSQPTASNYMRAAKVFGDLDCVDRFQPSALFVLARRNVPPTARQEAIRLARRGAKLSKAAAVRVVERYASSRQEKDRSPDRLRRAMLKALPKLSAEQIRSLAEELLRIADERRIQTPPSTSAETGPDTSVRRNRGDLRGIPLVGEATRMTHSRPRRPKPLVESPLR